VITVAGLVLIVTPSQYGWIGPLNALVALPILVSMPIAAGIAILRYRLYEIDRVINRTLVYGLLTVGLGTVYVVGVFGLGRLLNPVTGESALAVAASTLAVAALFQPAQHRIQAVVDRRFNRRKYNAAKTIETFSARLRDQVDLDTLARELLTVTDKRWNQRRYPCGFDHRTKSPNPVRRVGTTDQRRARRPTALRSSANKARMAGGHGKAGAGVERNRAWLLVGLVVDLSAGGVALH
jgi:hypothetical protein